mgnify:CR=1 FL=1|jgi:hypothetical protein
MRDTLKQRLFDLGYGTGSKTPLEAITYIEELELELYEMNELYGSVKDGLEEKLAKAVEALRYIRDEDSGLYPSIKARAVLAELEK